MALPEKRKRTLPRPRPEGASHAANTGPTPPLPGRRLPAHRAPWRRTNTSMLSRLSLVVVLRLQALDAGHLHVLDKGVKLFGQKKKTRKHSKKREEGESLRHGRRFFGCGRVRCSGKRHDKYLSTTTKNKTNRRRGIIRTLDFAAVG